MDQITDLISMMWNSIIPFIGITATIIAAINLLGQIVMLFYLALKDFQDTIIRAGGWLIVFLFWNFPQMIWPRLRVRRRNPLSDLVEGPAIQNDTVHILLILGGYSIVCVIIVYLAVP